MYLEYAPEKRDAKIKVQIVLDEDQRQIQKV